MNYAYTTVSDMAHLFENYTSPPDGQYHWQWKDTCWDSVELFPEHGPEE